MHPVVAGRTPRVQVDGSGGQGESPQGWGSVDIPKPRAHWLQEPVLHLRFEGQCNLSKITCARLN